MPGDHQLFIGRNDPRETLLPRDEIRESPWTLAFIIELNSSHADDRQIRLRISAEFSPIPAVKTSPSTPPKYGGQCADLFRRTVDEVVNGEARFWFRALEEDRAYRCSSLRCQAGQIFYRASFGTHSQSFADFETGAE